MANILSRTYKLFKISRVDSKEKLVKEFPNNYEAMYKIKGILGLAEFRKCEFEYDPYTGTDVYKDGKKIFSIHKELTYDV